MSDTTVSRHHDSMASTMISWCILGLDIGFFEGVPSMKRNYGSLKALIVSRGCRLKNPLLCVA